jgi:hypothetical protein
MRLIFWLGHIVSAAAWMVLLLLARMGRLGHELDVLLLDAGNLLENWMVILSSHISTGNVLETLPAQKSMIRSPTLDIVRWNRHVSH